LLNKNGEFVVEPGKYDQIGTFRDGIAKVYKDGKSGFIDLQGHEIVKLGQYDSVFEFNEGMGRVIRVYRQHRESNHTTQI
jgi:hypothetical protein